MESFAAMVEDASGVALAHEWLWRIGIALALLLRLAAENPRVLATPAADVLVTKLGESSVDLVLRAWVATPVYAEVRSELIEAMAVGFATAGISIPYPQRDLHVYHHDADGRPLPQLAAAVEDPDRG